GSGRGGRGGGGGGPGGPGGGGCPAEPVSCRTRGSARGGVRPPPPAVPLASYTTTSRPAWASVTAAVRPFGPEPMTIASGTVPIVVHDGASRLELRASYPRLLALNVSHAFGLPVS